MTVWLLRTSTGQYLGRVFASEELAEVARSQLKEAEALEGWYSGYSIKEVEIEGHKKPKNPFGKVGFYE